MGEKQEIEEAGMQEAEMLEVGIQEAEPQKVAEMQEAEMQEVGIREAEPQKATGAQEAEAQEIEIEEMRYTVEELSEELDRVKKNRDNRVIFRRTALGLATVSAIAILVAVLFLPVLQIYGNSMTPTLHEDDIVISVKGVDFEQSDVVSFYYNNNILVKRVIGFPGDWIDMDDDGNVSVNGVLLNEPYVTDKAYGDCNIKFPYQVPDGCIFVMGDHRSTSKDSRNSSMGPIPKEKIVGKIIYRFWPLSKTGVVE